MIETGQFKVSADRRGQAGKNENIRGDSMTENKISFYEESQENKNQILAVVDNQNLITALEEMAESQQAQLRLGRPQTPDIFVFPAHVKIVDREYLGQESWELFCAQLAGQYGKDQAPLIIADTNLTKTQAEYRELSAPEGKIKYIQQSAVNLILETARQMMRNNNAEITAVKAVKPEEIPSESERIEIDIPSEDEPESK